MIASQLSGHCSVISRTKTEWVRHGDDVWSSSCLSSFMDSLCRVRNKIMYVLSWRTVSVLTRVLFWYLFPSLLRNSGNKHQNNPLVSAETVRHSSTFIILYVLTPIYNEIILHSHQNQGVISLMFLELSKTIWRKYTMPEITFILRISSWNFARVLEAWLWAHILSFRLKFSEVRFLQYARIFWRPQEMLVKLPPLTPSTAQLWIAKAGNF